MFQMKHLHSDDTKVSQHPPNPDDVEVPDFLTGQEEIDFWRPVFNPATEITPPTTRSRPGSISVPQPHKEYDHLPTTPMRSKAHVHPSSSTIRSIDWEDDGTVISHTNKEICPF